MTAPADADDAGAQAAAAAGLVRADPAAAGLTRRRRGRGFSYHDVDGSPVADPDEIARARALVIPPAWRDVWIAPDPDAHIQAIGTDAAGRRQYRYHDEWRRRRDVDKHDRVLALGTALAGVRAEVAERIATRGLTRERVLAGAVRMLDIGVFRAGGEQYAPACGPDGDGDRDDVDDDEDSGGTFGLATLRREHVSLRRGAVRFCYPAKGGIPRTLALRDPALHALVGSLLRRRGGGDELLAYKVRRDWVDVRSADLNAAVKELAGDGYTCKDLRTWNATVLAAVTLAGLAARNGVPASERGRRRMANAAVKQVAEHLGNTPAVARASYVDPRVLERFDDGATVLTALRSLHGETEAAAPDATDDDARAAVERAVIRLIRSS